MNQYYVGASGQPMAPHPGMMYAINPATPYPQLPVSCYAGASGHFTDPNTGYTYRDVHMGQPNANYYSSAQQSVQGNELLQRFLASNQDTADKDEYNNMYMPINVTNKRVEELGSTQIPGMASYEGSEHSSVVTAPDSVNQIVRQAPVGAELPTVGSQDRMETAIDDPRVQWTIGSVGSIQGQQQMPQLEDSVSVPAGAAPGEDSQQLRRSQSLKDRSKPTIEAYVAEQQTPQTSPTVQRRQSLFNMVAQPLVSQAQIVPNPLSCPSLPHGASYPAQTGPPAVPTHHPHQHHPTYPGLGHPHQAFMPQHQYIVSYPTVAPQAHYHPLQSNYSTHQPQSHPPNVQAFHGTLPGYPPVIPNQQTGANVMPNLAQQPNVIQHPNMVPHQPNIVQQQSNVVQSQQTTAQLQQSSTVPPQPNVGQPPNMLHSQQNLAPPQHIVQHQQPNVVQQPQSHN